MLNACDSRLPERLCGPPQQDFQGSFSNGSFCEASPNDSINEHGPLPVEYSRSSETLWEHSRPLRGNFSRQKKRSRKVSSRPCAASEAATAPPDAQANGESCHDKGSLHLDCKVREGVKDKAEQEFTTSLAEELRQAHLRIAAARQEISQIESVLGNLVGKYDTAALPVRVDAKVSAAVTTATKEQEYKKTDEESTKPRIAGQSLVPRFPSLGGKRMKKSVLSLDPKLPLQQAILRHAFFDGMSACVIILNSIMIGVETDMAARENPFEVPLWLFVVSLTCNVYFTAEVLVRLILLRGAFFTDETKFWNIFDLTVVTTSLVDYALQGRGNTSVVRMLRMLRITRLLRVFRFAGELARLASMIMESMKTLAWTLVMVCLSMYVFAVALTSRCSEWLKAQADMGKHGWHEVLADSENEYVSQMAIRFGGLLPSWHTLVMCVLGGTDWGDLTTMLLETDIFAMLLLLIYILFTMLAMLNIVTGVFLDNALQCAKSQAEYRIERQLQDRAAKDKHMKGFFDSIDLDSSGAVSKDELLEALQSDSEVEAFFQVIGFNVSHVDDIFDLFVGDGKRELRFDQFVECVRALRGNARAIDLKRLEKEIRELKHKVVTF